MNSTANLCDTSTLEACLRGELSSEELRRLEEHLEQCDACRETLQLRAASAEQWSHAEACLRDDDNDLEHLGDAVEAAGMPPNYRRLIQALHPSDDPRMLGRLGPFEIAGIIGSGGMGVVLKAFDPALSRFVAMKVLSPHLWNDDRSRDRFSREARAAASVIHDNVIEIYSVSEAAGIPYFTMPYLRGETLQQRIDKHGPLGLEEILRISKQLAEGLAAAHSQGVVHRDIKPANVLLTDGAERVCLTDFGLARVEPDEQMTQTGYLAGTPAFMSPEQVKGKPLDARSDLFSLGSLIYTMCAGRPPFAANSTFEELEKVAGAAPPRLEAVNPDIPTWLAAIVHRLHQSSPADRYQTAAELTLDLQLCLAHLQSPGSCSQPRNVTKLQTRYLRSAPAPVHQRMRRRAVAGGGFIVASLALAWMWPGKPAQVGGPPGESTVAVEGRVVDESGKPLAEARVLAVQKTWPNNRYRQRSLQTKTDQKGRFRFERFAERGEQYAFLLTALPDGHSMTSTYRLVRDGRPQEPVTLESEKSRPATVRVVDTDGKPVPNAKLLPRQRVTADSETHMTYAMQVADAGVPTSEDGEVTIDAFQPGDQATVTVAIAGDISEHEIEIDQQNAEVVVQRKPPQVPAGAPVDVRGRVVDENGEPMTGATVIAVRKTWPNNRYRQDGLTAKTDANGRFQFEDFAPINRQYAFLLTIIEEGYAMTSEYRLLRDGSQQDPVTLTVQRATPVTFVVRGADGKPLQGVELSPNSREGEYLNYHMNREHSTRTSDAAGKATFTAWKRGEQGEIFYQWKNDAGQLSFRVPDSGPVELTLPKP